MINFEKFTLSNGLRVIVHPDKTTPFAVLNVLYNVGARDEEQNKTGFAHLFEHLMFSGSLNIPDYDTPLQNVGGTNNAFTSNDITNYYLTVPKENLETGFWLESDRMMGLALTENSFEVQRNVVCEEFRQNYINQPYGDIWHLMRAEAYKVHPYQWPTIGKEVSHVESATLEDVKDFYNKHYAPNNAVVVVSGDVTTEEVYALSQKWFGPIPQRKIEQRKLEQEPKQLAKRVLTVERDVPMDTFLWGYHMGGRLSDSYVCGDLTSDILSCGQSSRLYQSLVKNKQLFLEIDAFISGEEDPGQFNIIGKTAPGIDTDKAKAAVTDELNLLCNEMVSDYELEKVKNKFEANLLYTETSYLDKAMHLASFELHKDAGLINESVDRYRAVSKEELLQFAQTTFTENNCTELNYLRKNKKA